MGVEQTPNNVGRRATVRRAGLAALAAGLGAAAASGAAAAQPLPLLGGVVGSWRVRVPPGPNRSEIQLLFAFLPGGVFLGLDSPVEPPAGRGSAPDALDYAGPYAGQWLPSPDGTVRVTSLQLNYNRQAQVTSEEVTTYKLTYDAIRDTISGTWEWREVANDGSVLFSNTGPITGTRIKVEF